MRIYGNGIFVTNCEELDQYAGEQTIRSVLQSTMRGGEKYWSFKSFNPPISKNNWANMYAEAAAKRDDTLVISNSYLDVPPKWLGKQFIDEAEYLKELNYTAYQHEYLGIPTGTGGDVFSNVSDLDMSKPIDIGDGKTVPLWQTFDKIYTGIDWGWKKVA